MLTWHAFFLGLLQGVTEFLPVSSSGHLTLAQHFLGFENLQNYLLFNLICHLGTLFAIVLVFFKPLVQALNIRSRQFWLVVVATLPLFPLVFILKPLKELFENLEFLGPCFLLSSLILFIGLKWRTGALSSKTYSGPLTIGVFQALAVFPGISRSGTTVSVARVLGWSKEEAVQFSFFLAIPAILGGVILEGWTALHSNALTSHSISILSYLTAFFTALVSGYFSLKLLIHLLIHNKWYYFAWYCLLIGTLTTLYFNYFNRT